MYCSIAMQMLKIITVNFQNLSDSTFHSCFRHVDPTDFFQMCLNEVPRGDATGQVMEGVCRISAAYQRECRIQGIQVRMPKQCGEFSLDSYRVYF